MADAPKKYTYTSKYLVRWGWGFLAAAFIGMLLTTYTPVTIGGGFLSGLLYVSIGCLFASELTKRLEVIEGKLDELLAKKN